MSRARERVVCLLVRREIEIYYYVDSKKSLQTRGRGGFLESALI